MAAMLCPRVLRCGVWLPRSASSRMHALLPHQPRPRGAARRSLFFEPAHARRRDEGWSQPRKPQERVVYRFRWRMLDIGLTEQQLWQIALPVGTLLIGAAVVGPLLLGVTLFTVAIGAAASAGALAAVTLLLPLLALLGLPLLFGGSLLLGGTAVTALLASKLLLTTLSLAIAGGGLALGWGGVNWLLEQQRQGQQQDQQQAYKGGRDSSSSSSSVQQAVWVDIDLAGDRTTSAAATGPSGRKGKSQTAAGSSNAGNDTSGDNDDDDDARLAAQRELQAFDELLRAAEQRARQRP